MTKDEFERLNVNDKIDQLRSTFKNIPDKNKQEIFDFSEVLFNYRKNNSK